MPPAGGEPPAEPLEDLLEEARRRGFLGPGPVSRHVEHAHAMALAVEAVEPDVLAEHPGTPPPAGHAPSHLDYLDLGSGGGLPGLYLSTRWPGPGALLDANHRRCELLRRALVSLGAGDRVVVVEARAEAAARDPRWRGRFRVVVARSFAGPAATAECAVGFLSVGGVLAVSDPPASPSEERGSRWDAGGLADLGFEVLEAPAVGASVSLFRKASGSDRWPRRDGIPAKRPLWRS